MVTPLQVEPQELPEELTAEEVKNLLSGNDTGARRGSLRVSAGSFPLAAEADAYRQYKCYSAEDTRQRYSYLGELLDKYPIHDF